MFSFSHSLFSPSLFSLTLRGEKVNDDYIDMEERRRGGDDNDDDDDDNDDDDDDD